MDYHEIMIRYGELSTKGKNRKDFIQQLGNNVKAALQEFTSLKIITQYDRLHVILNGTPLYPVVDNLKMVFGIENFSPVLKVKKTRAAIFEAAKTLINAQYYPGMSFKINTKRQDHEFELDTNEINSQLGEYLLHEIPDLMVKMNGPDITLRVEVRLNGIFLSSETIKGAGGMPVGTGGRAIMMLSGGIDSPVASYMGMKRGVTLDMVHFFSPPYTSEKSLLKAKELSAKLAVYSGHLQFIAVPFAKIQENIKENIPEGYLMTIQRRMMLRLTEVLARKQGAKGIFTGESLGQVASQTLESMMAINDVTTMPVLRPLISMDKEEIIHIAKKIDTYNISVLPFEDCCTIFSPPAPKTRPDLEKVRNLEKLIDADALITDALSGVTVVNIRHSDNYMNQQEKVFEEIL